nr:uncharacterized protein LOC117276624 [Nicotiana tomentosiformis]
MSTRVLPNAMADRPLVIAANSKIDPSYSFGLFTKLQVPDICNPISSLTDREKCAPYENKGFDKISHHDEPALPCHFTCDESLFVPLVGQDQLVPCEIAQFPFTKNLCAKSNKLLAARALLFEMQPDLEDKKFEESFDEMLNSCCPPSFAKAQSDAPIKMIHEDAICPKSCEVQLFAKSPQRDMLVKYVTAPSFDHDPTKQQIEFETFEDMYIGEFLWELESIEDLYLDNSFKENEDDIPTSYMPSDKMLSDDGHRESTGGFNDHHILNRFPFDRGANFLYVTITLTVTNLYVWDPELSSEFMDLTCGTENEEVHTLFEEIRNKRSCLFAKLYDWVTVGGVETGVECSCNFQNSCTSYKLLGESKAHSFLYSFDGAPTHLEEQSIMWCHREIAYLIVVMHWILMELIHYEEVITRYSPVYKILMLLSCWVGVPNSKVLKLHQPSKILAMFAGKKGWKSKAPAHLLKLDKGLHCLNLMEESKLEHDNARYVLILYIAWSIKSISLCWKLYI